MSKKLPSISGKKLVHFLLSRGFEKKRQKGSHIILKKKGIKRSLVVPNYKELSEDVVLNNLKTARISREEFICAMRENK